MRIIFKKSNLPFLKNTLHGDGDARDYWSVARIMQDQNDLAHQLPTETLLLQRGAFGGDVWSMCELARTYYDHGGDLWLPHALSWWAKAAKMGDQGTLWDLANLPILQRILNYRGMDSEYANIEMQCAMLAEWFLTDLGRADWSGMSLSEKTRRCTALVYTVCPILRISTVSVEVVFGLTIGGIIADGGADPQGRLLLRGEMLEDYERLIEVIFHELGHFVAFAMWNPSPASARLEEIYGISRARVESWKNGAMGYEVPTSEEDPDTLSYGAYTQWATLFAMNS